MSKRFPASLGRQWNTKIQSQLNQCLRPDEPLCRSNIQLAQIKVDLTDGWEREVLFSALSKQPSFIILSYSPCRCRKMRGSQGRRPPNTSGKNAFCGPEIERSERYFGRSLPSLSLDQKGITSRGVHFLGKGKQVKFWSKMQPPGRTMPQ